MNKSKILKERKVGQLKQLQKFIREWSRLGKVIISRENLEKIGELRRSLASEFPPSLYLISPEARKGLDIKNITCFKLYNDTLWIGTNNISSLQRRRCLVWRRREHLSV
jgi:hypothetical protein